MVSKKQSRRDYRSTVSSILQLACWNYVRNRVRSKEMEQPLLFSMEWQIPVVTSVSGEGKQRPIRAGTKLFKPQ